MKRMTVLFEDDDLYTAIKVEAARRNRPLKDLVTDALRGWLEAQEDAELRPDLAVARSEWQAQGGTEAKQFFEQLNTEARAARGA